MECRGTKGAERVGPAALGRTRRREDLLKLLAMLDQQIAPLDLAVEQAAQENFQAKLLLSQPGVGAAFSLAFVLTMGDVSRFRRGKQVASYLGLIPREYSSGGHQRLGSISKQGNRFMRMLLVEAAQIAVRYDPGMRNEYLHRCHSKAKGVAKVAAAAGNWRFDSTGCCARKSRIRRSFVSRAARGWPWSAKARPQA